jgi:hypothetical protein
MRAIILSRITAGQEGKVKKLLLAVLMLSLVGTLAVACGGGGGGTTGPKTPSGLYKAAEVWANGATMDFQAGKKVVYNGNFTTRTYTYTIDSDNRLKMENVENGAIDYAQYTPAAESVLYSGVNFVKQASP